MRLLDVGTDWHGVECVGSKDACSILDTWCMCVVFHKGVGKSSLEPLS